MKEIELEKTRILKNERITDEVCLLTFEKHSHFQAGQVLSVTVNENIPPRIYSICSGEEDQAFTILFDVKYKGLLTPVMSELKEGDVIFTSRPYGNFVIPKDPAWLIATGTGIAPFRSALRSGKCDGKKIIHGAATREGFYFADEFSAMSPDGYIRCCSRERHEGFYYGRVTDYLRETKLSRDILYYLCGKTEMVVEVRDLLIQKGIPFNSIHTEIYF